MTGKKQTDLRKKTSLEQTTFRDNVVFEPSKNQQYDSSILIFTTCEKAEKAEKRLPKEPLFSRSFSWA